jgi:hypothetical protein
MTDALVSAYVRPEGAYITASDRTTVGVWMESADWEYVQTDRPEDLGEAVLRRLQDAPRIVRHPDRDEFSALRSGTIAPLLRLASVKSWKAFVSRAVLVDVRRGDAITVSPMRRDGRGFSPLAESSEVLDNEDRVVIGGAVLRAATIAFDHEGN